jgi:hypothetical protein
VLAPLAAGIDIVVRRRTASGRDGSGNDTFTTADTTYQGCAYWPGSAGRNVAGSNVYGAADFRNSVVTRDQLAFPDGAVIGPLDLARTPDGVWWRCVGEPEQWGSQLTGATSGIQVAVERVSG